MNEPRWLTIGEVEMMHEGVIDISGGAAGIRDPELLASALARPQNLYAYGETDIFRIAAGYAEAIAANHAFIDGNKRTAFFAALSFLEENGFALRSADQTEHADLMVKLATREIDRNDVADHFRRYSDPIA